MRIPDNTWLVQDPIHLGVVILDKIIGDLKSKLPFLNKKKGGEDDLEEEDGESEETETEVAGSDDDTGEKTTVAKPSLKSSKDDEEDETSPDEVSEDNSLVGKIKAKLNSFKKKETSEEAEEASEEGEEKAEKKSKKKPNLIVIAGAVALIGFVILSDFGEETSEVPDVANVPALKKRPKKVKPAEAKPVEEKPAEEKPAETAETKTETPAPDTAVTTAPETTPTTPTPDTTVTTAPETTPTPDTTVTPTPETATTPTPDTTATTAPETTPTPDMTMTTTPETPTTETPVAPDNSTVDSVTGDETTPSPDNLTEQILKDLEDQATTTEKKAVRTEYVTPPNYENVGRGLVYNCSGQHWACVDGPSYKTCEDNSSSTKFLKKKAECYPFNVYETQSGCEKMQNRMVSSSAKTEFCSEN